MTIVHNYSDLSPAMRDALLADPVPWGEAKENKPSVLVFRTQATLDALSKRGLVEQVGQHWQRYATLTDAGKRAVEHLKSDVPAKVVPILDKARDAGLDVARSETSGTLQSWTISSPNPIDSTQIWLYWGPGARGGRLGFSLYHGPGAKIRRSYPLRFINYTIQEMRDSLQRHHEREAARLTQARSALAQVFAELDGAEIPSDEETQAAEANGLTVTQLRAKRAEVADQMVEKLRDDESQNLLHEELNLSTVHANDGTGQALCRPHGVLNHEMTTVDYPVDCRACLAQAGRPAPIDLGGDPDGDLDGADYPPFPAGGVPWDQPGANPVADVAALKRVAEATPAEYDPDGTWVAGPPVADPHNAAKSFGQESELVLDCGCPAQIVTDEGHQEGCTHRRIDPTRPGWFMVGQYLYDHEATVHAEVAHVELEPDGRTRAVAVTLNGGYGGRWFWYGQHPEAQGRTLDMLEGPHIGLTEAQRRPWPKPRTAIERVKCLLSEQCLSGWPAAGGDRSGRYVIVNIPRGIDSERHRILIGRYLPYPCTVDVRASQAGQIGDAIIIRPRED